MTLPPRPARPERPARPARPERIGRPERAPAPLTPLPPRDIEFPDGATMEESAAVEVDETARAFRERRDQEAQRMAEQVEGLPYITVVCDTPAQVEALIREGFKVPDGDLYGGVFVDGRQVARNLGVTLPEANLRDMRKVGREPRLAALTMSAAKRPKR